MRIKFLSFIASFFIVSFVTTSCLDEENHIEYSSDATIHEFSLDTIGYGKTYKFTIDQLKGEIYNEDSLPVHADTIIDRILIKKLTTTSGIVSMKDKNNMDSIINLNDSVDLRKPMKIKVWSAEGFSTFDNTKTKDYTISVRIHKYDPDSLKWNRCGKVSDEMTANQKSVRFANKAFTYTLQGNELKVYTSENMSQWKLDAVQGLSQMPNSILALKNILIATTPDHKVYTSTDGIQWEMCNKIQGNVLAVISQQPMGDEVQFTYMKKEQETNNLYALLESDLAGTPEEIAAQEYKNKFTLSKQEEDNATFPVSNFTYANFPKGKGYMTVILGKHEPAIKVNGKEDTNAAIAWGFNGNTWARLGTTTKISYCPAYENPTLIYYNQKLYCWGDQFEGIYESDTQGFAWKKADSKFVFPMHDWNKSPNGPTAEGKQEFRGRKNYSVIQDTENHNIYILFGKENKVTFTEKVSKKEGDKVTTTTVERTYNHDSEVWCGRLNQLWFDLANAGK